MRIAMSLAMAALMAAACSKKEDAAPGAAKAPDAAAPSAAVAPADLQGPKPGKWKMTTQMAAMPQPVTVETCIAKTSFKDMQAAQQQAGVRCSDQTFNRVGGDLVMTATCDYPGGMKASINSRFSGDFDSKYVMESRTVMDPAPTPSMRETTVTVTAERIGDC